METIENVELAYLNAEDYQALKDLMDAAYAGMNSLHWKKEEIEKLVSLFPEGQVILKVNGELAGCALSVLQDDSITEKNHSYSDVTGNDTFKTHKKDGDLLYGIDVFISPKYRGLRLARRLYDFRKELCEQLNLKGIAFGARMPKYHLYAKELSPLQYLEKVKAKEIEDPVLNFQFNNDFHVKKILKNYLEGDTESLDHAVLMEWNNVYYEKPSAGPGSQTRVIRVGLVQWQMRPYSDLDELMSQAEFFLDSISGYHSDFALFPEFFNAPLMAAYNEIKESEAIRKLAGYTEEIVNRFSQLAVSYNINIITGSMPEIVNDKLRNVGYLCHRDGRLDRFEKIHVTPDEERVWGMEGGDILRSFDTDCGKIGILICYDVEFPELSRILAEEGMDILFVPFLTDTQNGYSRVRNTAQARAIENECYVVIAGSVGNLPKVSNMDIQFAQSMVFTPCDFAFPSTGIKAEATPNAEMILVVDLDINLLRELNEFGSVRNLKDRRLDLYRLTKLKA
ncbi:carbon-nitrogen hydrolase family protein [Croceimicrobium hydrocarbonivorans]|uniref:Bifunctional GNAT family N-acetyltransferase/carbon-nitrogen hydrolase family protein n=1 Tax=Croceimicrobium hydrocarbonivorans TaxID=2761580 RepID=A0A7H0VHW3_9FLAO|nr:carbon-nitrogen hydrolase family protein [Croceimicrobium hydrocarbonivorans]QNR25311.1 bifunctional GNAT family N-acetyltransferase/carbon-nitrogen hydrolase family protein [Croceimicrobium hydrocarbonivorans]